MTVVLIRSGDQDTESQREHHVKSQGEGGHLQAKREASEGTEPANTLISDA